MDLNGMHQKACVSLPKTGLAPFGAVGAVGAIGAVRWRRWRRWRRSAPFDLTNGSRSLSTLQGRTFNSPCPLVTLHVTTL